MRMHHGLGSRRRDPADDAQQVLRRVEASATGPISATALPPCDGAPSAPSVKSQTLPSASAGNDILDQPRPRPPRSAGKVSTCQIQRAVRQLSDFLLRRRREGRTPLAPPPAPATAPTLSQRANTPGMRRAGRQRRASSSISNTGLVVLNCAQSAQTVTATAGKSLRSRFPVSTQQRSASVWAGTRIGSVSCCSLQTAQGFLHAALRNTTVPANNHHPVHAAR